MDDLFLAISRRALGAITLFAYMAFDAADLPERFGREGRSRPFQNACFHFSLTSLRLLIRDSLYLLPQHLSPGKLLLNARFLHFGEHIRNTMSQNIMSVYSVLSVKHE